MTQPTTESLVVQPSAYTYKPRWYRHETPRQRARHCLMYKKVFSTKCRWRYRCSTSIPSVNATASVQSARIPSITRTLSGISCVSTAKCILVLSPPFVHPMPWLSTVAWGWTLQWLARSPTICNLVHQSSVPAAPNSCLRYRGGDGLASWDAESKLALSAY